MAANPVDISVKSYDSAKAFRAPVGATTLRPGTLAKFTANVLVPCVATDKQIRVFVVLENGDANAASTLVVPLADCRLELGYSGAAPTVGTDYGIADASTVLTSDTTNKLVTVTAVNTGRTTCDVIEYQLAG